jgi:hypothetical protein
MMMNKKGHMQMVFMTGDERRSLGGPKSAIVISVV